MLLVGDWVLTTSSRGWKGRSHRLSCAKLNPTSSEADINSDGPFEDGYGMSNVSAAQSTT
jgi:hypothetical protein